MNYLKRLAISCGGTSGHFLPGLAIAREFNRNGGKAILLIGGKHAEEQLESARKAGIEAFKIQAQPFAKKLPAFLRFLRAVCQGILESRRIMKEYQVQAFLSMGCYASFPPAAAAWLSHIPIFLHDGNALLGKMNLFMSRFAKAFALSFPSRNEKEAKCPTVVTGLPVRPEFLGASFSKEKAVREINKRFHTEFKAENPLILVFGGSLGARTINENFYISPQMPHADKVQVIQLTGQDEAAFQRVQKKWEHSPCHVLVLRSCNDMQLLYAAADLVVSRAGGSTVTELACLGKYAILIPFPFAAQHHQDDNARWLLQNGGGLMVPDDQCSPQRFEQLIAEWMPRREECIQKGLKSKELAKPEAAMNILHLIEQNIFSSEV